MSKMTLKNKILAIYTATLVATALVGLFFCGYAAIILIPALLPIVIIKVKQWSKTLKKARLNIA